MARKPDEYRPRMERLARGLRREKLDAFLVWDRANTRYLSGFKGSASLICLTAAGGHFLTDFRYVTLAQQTLSHLRIVMTEPPEGAQLAKILRRHHTKKVGFEETVPYRTYKAWKDKLEGIELVEATALVKRLREEKSRAELARIVSAQRIAERVLDRVLAKCRPGVTEKELARELLHAIEDEGGDGPSFDPIIAAGPNSALPHARPGDRRVKKGDFVIFDLGVFMDGYASDMTRTVVVGRATERQQRVYQTVLEAQRRAIARMRAGVGGKTVDHAARGWIAGKGFGKYFGHGTGHGVGLEIHESPAQNPQSKDVLRAGMVVTVEPGIYIPGWGGVRIEDMVLVKRSGREVLGRFPKRLIELPCD